MIRSSKSILVINISPWENLCTDARFIVLIPNYPIQNKSKKSDTDLSQSKNLEHKHYTDNEIQKFFDNILFQSPHFIRQQILVCSTVYLYLVEYNSITLNLNSYEIIAKKQSDLVNNALFSGFTESTKQNKQQISNENDMNSPIYFDMDFEPFTDQSQFTNQSPFPAIKPRKTIKTKIIGHIECDGYSTKLPLLYNCEMIQPDIVKFQIEPQKWNAFLKYTKRFSEFPVSIYFPIDSDDQSLILKQQYYAKIIRLEDENQYERWVYCELITPE